METIAKIRRLYHVERLGFKTIAKALNISKNTVKNIIRREQVSPNVIRRSAHHPVLEPFIQILKARLTEDEQAPKKYRRTAKKLFLELQQEGYGGSYDAVHRFISRLKQEHSRGLPQAYVPLVFEPGEAFQFDWSHEEVLLRGRLNKD